MVLNMSRRSFAILVGLLVGAVGLWATGSAEDDSSGAAAAATQEPEMVQNIHGNMVAKPQYGGQVIAPSRPGNDNWDPRITNDLNEITLPAYDTLIEPDWRKSLAGSGESEFYGFNEDFRGLWTGSVTEFEMLDPQTVRFSVRPGVRFWSDPPRRDSSLSGVYGREIDAHDILASRNAAAEHPQGRIHGGAEEHTWRLIDDMTLEWKFPLPDATGFTLFRAMSFQVVPREAVDREVWSDWRDAIGTGPFIPEEYVEGSFTLFKRNPDFWQNDPNLPDFELPYLDSLRRVVFNDEATRFAALRSGQLDMEWAGAWGLGVPPAEADSLRNAGVLLTEGPGSPHFFATRLDSDSPWADRRVRHAVMLGIDHYGVAENVYDGASRAYYWGSVPADGAYHLSREELAEKRPDLAHLWDFDPQEARQRLADAGYPDGFDTELLTCPMMAEFAELHQSYLRDIGINMSIRVIDCGDFWAQVAPAENPAHDIATHIGGMPVRHPADNFAVFHPTTAIHPASGRFPDLPEGPVLLEMYERWLRETDAAENARIWKEIELVLIDLMPFIPLPDELQFNAYQPWLKNYHGIGVVAGNAARMSKFIWIDAEEKERLSGRAAGE